MRNQSSENWARTICEVYLNDRTCGHPVNGEFGTVFNSVPRNGELMTPRDNQRSGEVWGKIRENKTGSSWRVINWVKGNEAESNGTSGNNVCVAE